MYKRFLFLIIFLFTFICCNKGDTLFGLYSTPYVGTTIDFGALSNIDYNTSNEILESLINKNNFSYKFTDKGILYSIKNSVLSYDIEFLYLVNGIYYSGVRDTIITSDFICLNKKNSFYTQDNLYVCEMYNILIFRIDDIFYQIPYTIKVLTDLSKISDIKLIL